MTDTKKEGIGANQSPLNKTKNTVNEIISQKQEIYNQILGLIKTKYTGKPVVEKRVTILMGFCERVLFECRRRIPDITELKEAEEKGLLVAVLPLTSRKKSEEEGRVRGGLIEYIQEYWMENWHWQNNHVQPETLRKIRKILRELGCFDFDDQPSNSVVRGELIKTPPLINISISKLLLVAEAAEQILIDLGYEVAEVAKDEKGNIVVLNKGGFRDTPLIPSIARKTRKFYNRYFEGKTQYRRAQEEIEDSGNSEKPLAIAPKPWYFFDVEEKLYYLEKVAKYYGRNAIAFLCLYGQKFKNVRWGFS